jgi:hypothetical protein
LQVLQVAQVLLGSGIDAGITRANVNGPRAQTLIPKRELERQAVVLGLDKDAFIDDQLGVSVFQGSQPQFSPVKFSILSRLDTPLSRIIDALSNAESIAQRLSPRITLASELYCSTHFEASIRAKFLTLMTAVEVLSDPEEPSKHVEKGRSIIGRVMPTRLQPKYRRSWDDCYTARCVLVHEGRTSEGLGQLFTGLDQLVRGLFVYELGIQLSFLPWDIE